MRILLVTGARPNFIKIAPLYNEMEGSPEMEPIIVHTGQHYDYYMSTVFFKDLEIPEPDINLGVGSGTHAEQTGRIMIEIEKQIISICPSLVMVVGDVNSTLAAAVAAAKLQVPVAHVEAGLRSFDRTMPEEINRQVTDLLSEYLFTTEGSADENLRREGVKDGRIHFVGNIMIDSLMRIEDKIDESTNELRIKGDYLQPPYALITLHRPSNVDSRERLKGILDAVAELAREIQVVFPIHPRTQKMVREFGLEDSLGSIYVTGPLGYTQFVDLESKAKFVLTDSGCVQDETTYFRIPCLTIRENTERPVTVERGTNNIVGTDRDRIIAEGYRIIKGKIKKGDIPPLWDGKTARRIVEVILKSL